MKKSIVVLAVGLITLSNISQASNGSANSAAIHINFSGTTPLCLAISKGDVSFVKKLIEYGADINEKSNGMTPLMVAARYNCTDIVSLLI